MQWAKWILPAILAINGAVMMLVPAWWYPRVPGVIETGPLNDHFVRDIGAAYLACAVALGWAVRDPARGLGVAVAAAAFLTLHAAIHLITPFCGAGLPWPLLARDFPGVFLPAIVSLLVVRSCVRRQKRTA
ncbi:hypothetical protein [Caulobacter rhizosphaerae]|jgi:hypothetical protein|uniref:hypothetical protein n=1 Tax=Caulobacter rhizosphaerae TaxID=2010972 RepID=UPI0013D60AEA|nr:hypothetical protein [Caulobacter rhizosphaerae]GGL48872.1 hypothetical protein GCM10010983_52750 [Caulobacter rhizosphaerae]